MRIIRSTTLAYDFSSMRSSLSAHKYQKSPSDAYAFDFLTYQTTILIILTQVQKKNINKYYQDV